jgi:predicted GIY-YIG superfamily endonuclease
MKPAELKLSQATATAILGIDTLWGGDVLNPSGTGRFIADSWFSDQLLPKAYRHPAAARLRSSGGVAGKQIDVAAVDAYLKAVDIPAAIGDLNEMAGVIKGLRGAYLQGLSECLGVMWDLVQERLDRGPAVPYERCVVASTGMAPTASDPVARRERVTELLARQGYRSGTRTKLLAAVDAWRRDRTVPKKSIAMLADAFIAQFDAGAAKHIAPYLPRSLRGVPRANIQFLAIEDAWFSGSMNYLGRARNRDGSPQYEATYEINASLEISVPEFMQLVSHEVVPGHVTTFALLQALHVRRKLGFESTVLTMNTRCAALSEGIANNAILMAFGVTEVDELPDLDLQIGTLLALLQDDAKNQSSFLTWDRNWSTEKVRGVLRDEYLCSDERADKLSGAWGCHPLLGRMYLPAYRAGTDKVAALRRRYPPEKIIPALYGALGMVDLVTIDQVLDPETANVASLAKPWAAYLLTCHGGKSYIGISPSPQARFDVHQAGRGGAFTRANRPQSLAAVVWFENRSAAASMEARLKALERPAKLQWFQEFAATTASSPATLDHGLASLSRNRR